MTGESLGPPVLISANVLSLAEACVLPALRPEVKDEKWPFSISLGRPTLNLGISVSSFFSFFKGVRWLASKLLLRVRAIQVDGYDKFLNAE